MTKQELIKELSEYAQEAELRYEKHNKDGEVLLFKHEYGKYWAYSQAEKLTKQLDEPKECEFKFYKCSICGFREEDDYRREIMCFCSNCGAKIRGKNE